VRLLGELADVLRVIGRYLDDQGGRDPRIRYDRDVEVSWRSESGDQERASTDFDINKLREQAPLMRRPVPLPRKGDREELLRTLGQELDIQGIEVIEISETGGSFRVHGRFAGQTVHRFYSEKELRKLSEERRALRRVVPAEDDPSPTV
jgi:hypothetical protein